MQIFKKTTSQKNIYLLEKLPNEIAFRPNEKSIAHYTNYKENSLGCLRCPNPKCCYYNKDEIQISSLIDFPFDLNNNVCPASAIKMNDDGTPFIEKNKCIKCGLCLSRCPIGSLFFNKDNDVQVNIDTSMHIKTSLSEESLKRHNEQIASIISLKKTGKMINESDDLLQTIYTKIENTDSKSHNLLGRNLLIGLGCVVGKTRTGDVYTRMDAIYSSKDDAMGAVEIEFGKETLDASRAILDDIAVLNVRYNLHKNDNNAIVICLQLPNARQGYWQVIKDLKTVEQIKIQTMSIGSILLLIWNNKCISFGKKQFYIDFDNKELRNVISKIIGEEINLSNKQLGILEPEK